MDMDAFIDYLTGQNFYYWSFVIIIILVMLAGRIGYIAGKGRKYRKCDCKDPEVSDVIICEKCEKNIEV